MVRSNIFIKEEKPKQLERQWNENVKTRSEIEVGSRQTEKNMIDEADLKSLSVENCRDSSE